MMKHAKLVLATMAATIVALAFFWLVPAPQRADAVEASVTLRQQHPSCDRQLWEHLDRRAMQRAAVYCRERGGIDDDTVRWVHHDSAFGAEQLCVVHLHYGCHGQLPGDDTQRT
jgi:hypothetical protein